MRHCQVATFYRPALAIASDHPQYVPGSYAPTEQQAASSSTPPRISMSTRTKRRLHRHETRGRMLARPRRGVMENQSIVSPHLDRTCRARLRMVGA